MSALEWLGMRVRPTDLVPPGVVIVVRPPSLYADSAIPDSLLAYNPLAPTGYRSAVDRAVRPCPGYTTRTLGEREHARMRRRRARGLKA